MPKIAKIGQETNILAFLDIEDFLDFDGQKLVFMC